MVLERKKRQIDQLHALKSMVRVSFLACTTIGHVETLRRSQTQARKRELALTFEAAWFTVYFYFNSFSIRLLRDETHPKHFSHQLISLSIDW